ncbi:MAG TPA: carbohydrate kinase [Streptosporangiaceae bacterium]|nr:carbohydrate kinase [Streptosporangiaceae bacterium]
MSPYVAVIGENVADAVVQARCAAEGSTVLTVHAGGGPANTAVALAQLGTPARFVSRLAGGALGRLLHDRLIRSGVDLTNSVPADEPATLAIASVDDSGRTAYEFYATGTADWQWRPGELDPRQLSEARCIHAGSLALIMEPGGHVIEDTLRAARGHATISIDPNVRTSLIAPDRYRDRLGAWCEMADILRLSDEDLAHLYPDRPVEHVFAQWHDIGVRLVVLTAGKQGAQASLDGERISVPAVPVKIIDTVGAGDAFSAALLHWLWRHEQLGGRLTKLTPDDAWRALRFATYLAALTCTVAGANAPWADHLDSAAASLLAG